MVTPGAVRDVGPTCIGMHGSDVTLESAAISCGCSVGMLTEGRKRAVQNLDSLTATDKSLLVLGNQVGTASGRLPAPTCTCACVSPLCN